MDVMVTVPLKFPLAVGENFTLKLTLCPEARLTGKLKPLMLNPEPVICAAEIVRLDPPELVSVSAMVLGLPVCTLPKLRLAGLGVKSPAEIPVPDKGMLSEGFDASEVIVTLPLALPVPVGVNVTLKLALCPEVSVTGK